MASLVRTILWSWTLNGLDFKGYVEEKTRNELSFQDVCAALMFPWRLKIINLKCYQTAGLKIFLTNPQSSSLGIE